MVRAIKAIIQRGEGILLIKKSDQVDIYPGRWDLPGGRLEEGETWCEGLGREVREETGLRVEYLRLVRKWESSHWKTVGRTVLCNYVGGEVTLSWEHTEFTWKTREEIAGGDYPEWIKSDVASTRK